MRDELFELLAALDGVNQDPRWHPERDALFHSLQAFEHARRLTSDRTLWATALLHDVGKAVSGADHDEVGADLLDGLVSPRIVTLVRHHLCLLREPGRTRRRHKGTTFLSELELLRRCDVGGREPRARVCDLDEAIDLVIDAVIDGASDDAEVDRSKNELHFDITFNPARHHGSRKEGS